MFLAKQNNRSCVTIRDTQCDDRSFAKMLQIFGNIVLQNKHQLNVIKTFCICTNDPSLHSVSFLISVKQINTLKRNNMLNTTTINRASSPRQLVTQWYLSTSTLHRIEHEQSNSIVETFLKHQSFLKIETLEWKCNRRVTFSFFMDSEFRWTRTDTLVCQKVVNTAFHHFHQYNMLSFLSTLKLRRTRTIKLMFIKFIHTTLYRHLINVEMTL